MQEPSINDTEYVLIWKLAHNLWEAAGGESTGVTEPDYGHDDEFTLLKKAVASSALL